MKKGAQGVPRVDKMAKTMEKLTLNGKGVTANEKMVYELVAANGEVTAADLVDKVVGLNLFSVRATLARLDKQTGLLKSKVVLKNDKPVKSYEVA